MQKLIWAANFARMSLGTVGALDIPVTHGVGAAGAPFFGFVHDLTGSYRSSFRAFVAALLHAAFLSLAVQGRAKVPRW